MGNPLIQELPFDERVEHEQLYQLMQRMGGSFGGSLGFVLLGVFLFWSSLTQAMWGWVFAQIATSAICALVFFTYNKDQNNFQRRRFWKSALYASTAIRSLSWGLLGIFMDFSTYNALLIYFMCGLLASASVNTHIYSLDSKLNALNTSLNLLPIFVRQLFYFDEFSSMIIISAPSYVIFLLMISSSVRKNTMDLIILKLEANELSKDRDHALKHARSNSKSKDRFLSSVSHDLRTPLIGVLNLCQINNLEINPANASKQIPIIRSTCEHLLSIIDDLLDFASIEAGKISLLPGPFDLQQLQLEIQAILNPLAAKKGLALRIECQTPAGIRLLQGDSKRIRQVLINIVGNAIKFTEKGYVDVLLLSTGQRLIARVTDTGKGIPIEMLDRIFEPFEQLNGESLSSNSTGSGLGLSISRELAHAMKGQLHCTASSHRGSTFEFECPCPALPGTEPDTQANVSTNFEGRVLLVEDEPVSLMLAEGMLKRLGFTVITAQDGPQALVLLESQSFDCVLMDGHLSGIDGWEVTQRWRAYEVTMKRKPLPILGTTADTLYSTKQRCINAGMNDVMSKPYHLDVLAQKLSALLTSETISA